MSARWRVRHRIGWPALSAPVVLTLLLAVLGPVLAPHRATAIVGLPYQPPAGGLPLGADHLGRDVWSQILTGARGIALTPLLAVVISGLIGVPLGLRAGWRGGWAARLALSGSQLVLALPPLLLILLALNVSHSAVATVVAVALVSTPSTIRYLRTATARIASAGYVEYATAIGERPAAIIGRELVPALIGPILADAGLRLVGAIYLVASLSFLGLATTGGQNWATMIAENADAGGLNTLALAAPAACIALFSVSVNLLADRFVRRVQGGGR